MASTPLKASHLCYWCPRLHHCHKFRICLLTRTRTNSPPPSRNLAQIPSWSWTGSESGIWAKGLSWSMSWGSTRFCPHGSRTKIREPSSALAKGPFWFGTKGFPGTTTWLPSLIWPICQPRRWPPARWQHDVEDWPQGNYLIVFRAFDIDTNLASVVSASFDWACWELGQRRLLSLGLCQEDSHGCGQEQS